MNAIYEKLAYLAIGKAVMLSLFLGGLYYYMGFDDGSSYEAKAAELQQLIAAEESKKVQTEKAKAEAERSEELIKQLSADIRRVTAQMPTTLKGLDVTRVIDEAAQRSQLKVSAKRPGQSQKIQSASAEEIPVEIEMQGKYFQFAKFLVDIGALDQITRVKSFKLIGSEDKKEPSKLKIIALVSGYRSVAPESTEEGAQQ